MTYYDYDCYNLTFAFNKYFLLRLNLMKKYHKEKNHET